MTGRQFSVEKGGMGYGAGGGAGGFFGFNSTRYAGGDGADGLVYIEYAAFCISETCKAPRVRGFGFKKYRRAYRIYVLF